MKREGQIISEALEAWNKGRLVAIPTETVYGMGAPIHNENLLKKIFEVKQRPFFDPLIIHVSSLEMAKAYVKEWGPLQDLLASRFWPGPLTFVMPKGQRISSLITSGLPTVGVRFPQQSLTCQLIERLGEPVAAPSANKFTKTSPTRVEHVREQFDERDVYIMEAPPSQGGIESTILSFGEKREKRIQILRPGLITESLLREVLPSDYSIEREGTAFEKGQGGMDSPGQLPLHYCPDYPLALFDEGAKTRKKKESLLLENSNLSVEFVRLELNPYVTARQLYTLMREPLSQGKSSRCFILPQERGSLPLREREIWESLLNRLSKASTFSLDESV